MRFIVSIDIEFIMSTDTKNFMYIDIEKETYMKVIVSIDIKSIMSIDTINVVYIDMKKRNLREGYCIYTQNNSQSERDTACRVGWRRGMGDNIDKSLCGGRGSGCPLCISFRRIVSISFSPMSVPRRILRSGFVIGQ